MDPNRNDSPKRNNNPGDGKKPRNLFSALVITVVVVLVLSLVYNAVVDSQFTDKNTLLCPQLIENLVFPFNGKHGDTSFRCLIKPHETT